MTTTTLKLGTSINCTRFQVTHNLDEFGFDIQKAFRWWIANRKILTPHMFCRYIRQRDKAFVCMTTEEESKIKKHFKFKAQ